MVAIASGSLHNEALTSDGVVWTWGCNDDEALGRDGDEWLPAAVKGDLEGKVVIKIASGSSHTLALTVDGHLYLWGTYRSSQGVIGYLHLLLSK